MSTEAKERQEFRFTIKYHGEKATRLVSGNLTRSEICYIFKDDLTALRVNHPKLEKIRHDPFGSIYFTYIVDQNTDQQHKRYQTIEATQYKDPDIFDVKSRRSIQHITTVLEKNAPKYNSSRVKKEPVSRISDADKSDRFVESVPMSPPCGPSFNGRARKRPRLSIEPELQKRADRPSPVIDPRARALVVEELPASQASPKSSDIIPVESPQTSSIKTEQVEASAAAALNPPNTVVAIPAKTFISLKTKSANSKTPISPRHNALTAYAKTQEVNRLTRELWDTRRVLSAAQARESSLLRELQKLTRVNLSGAADNQEQLADMKARLASSETELESERTKRLQAEQYLRDVERECRSPFVVPALLKAFRAISQMTDSGLMSSLAVDVDE